MWRIVILIILFEGAFWYNSHAQQSDSTRSEVQDDLERVLENFDTDDPESDSEQLTQFLQDLAANPVNVNTASVDELLQIPGLNLKMGKAIVEYREEVKPFESVDELVEIRGIGVATLDRIKPYITIGSGVELGKILYSDYRYWMNNGRFEAFSRYQQTLQEQEGYNRPDSAGYMGSPVKYYQRFRYRSHHLSVNLTQEKDAGEPLSNPTGFDFNSWHLALEDNGKLQDFVVGDYNLTFGQGLVLWNGGAFGKGREVVGSVIKNERGIHPYTSAQEANYFRGVAATYGGKLKVTGFYSNQHRDATVVNGDTTRFPGHTGLHRTNTEIGKKGNVRQKLYGGRIRAQLPLGFIGISGYHTSYSTYIDPGAAVYNRYDFKGDQTSTFGLDYKFLVGPAQVFGEGAYSRNGGYGMIAGVESSIGSGTDVVLAYRNYKKDFQSLFGSGFGEQSGEPKNEEGTYLGLAHELNQNILFRAYFDQYRFPSARFGTNQPTAGYDWLGMLEVNLNRNFRFYVQARSEKEEDEFETVDDLGRARRKLGISLRTSIRGHLEYRINKKVRLRSRGEFVKTRQPGEDPETGYLIYQDLRYEPGSKWKFDARITMFDTKSYDSRVYQFENDLLYVFSNSVLFDQGQRMYLLINYEPVDFIEIWAKIGLTVFENRQVVGSGLDEIKGNRRSKIGVQVRVVI